MQEVERVQKASLEAMAPPRDAGESAPECDAHLSLNATPRAASPFRLIWGPELVIFASHHVVSCRISLGEAFVAIYLRHGPTEKLGIYLNNCRDKYAQGK